MSVAYGYCHCGCGERTRPAANNSNGNTKGEPQKYLRGHRSRLFASGPDFFVADRGHETLCWIWQRYITPSTGYGLAWDGERKTTAHKLMYERHVGPVPEGLQLDHLCRVRECCRPEHLEPVTNAVNVRRSRRAKLTEDTVREIRSAAERGVSYATIASRFGISKGYVSQVVTRRTWVEVA